MNRRNLTRFAALACFAVVALMLPPAVSVFAIHGHQCSSQCVKCPKCDGCCKLDVSEDKEKKTYYEVESEQICIPRFVFPWQNPKPTSCGCGHEDCSGSCTSCTAVGGEESGKCGPVNHNGACIRTVCRLKKKSRECPKCKYTWSVEDGGPDSCTSDSCTSESLHGVVKDVSS